MSTSLVKPLNGMRHTMIYDPSQYQNKKVAVVGVGTIGSHLAHTLARMQVPMTLFDHDTVEEHNLATQTYGASDIGRNKVDAVLDQLLHIQPDNAHAVYAEMFELKEGSTYDIIVSAVDSLDARRAIAELLIEKGIEVPIVDGRVGAEQVEVYYFPNAEAWLAQIPPAGDEDPCGARFTAYTANICAGLMANNVKKILMQNRSIPSRIIYDAATSIFIKEN